MIILPGDLPEPKTLCPKAQARGIPCTVDRCDHSGGYLLLVIEETSLLDSQQGTCKTCGADPDPTTIFDQALALP